MYKSRPDVDSFFREFFSLGRDCSLENVLIATPSIWIERAVRLAGDRPLHIGAQNISSHEEGAFTGEISAKMVQSAGASFCLVGHSERRMHYHETHEEIHEKIKLLLSHAVHPLLCIGESKEERAAGNEKKVLKEQILRALTGVPLTGLKHIFIAYEPIWSIGTGNLPDPSLISEIHQYCKETLLEHFGESASLIPMLYGGSVKSDNVQSLLSEKDVDGVLVGGASLSPQQFIDIILKGTQI